MTQNNHFKLFEEKDTDRCYPRSYTLRSLTDQINRLRELFPGISNANERLAEGPPPEGAEGWFAIPQWQKIAPTYNEAVRKVLDLIEQTRRGEFYDYCGYHFTSDLKCKTKQFWQNAGTVSAFQELGNEQKGNDILVVPAQFGLRHRGRSVRRARECFEANEFDLNAFSVGIMLLTHPERLARFDDLNVKCAGDEFDDPHFSDRFCQLPSFIFEDRKVIFTMTEFYLTNMGSGPASGFVPQ